MFLVMYDIEKDKLRTNFAKFLNKYGRRVQYSVFEIKNSERILRNIEIEIEGNFRKKFGQGDSVLIYDIGDKNCIRRYGYAINEESDLLIT